MHYIYIRTAFTGYIYMYIYIHIYIYLYSPCMHMDTLDIYRTYIFTLFHVQQGQMSLINEPNVSTEVQRHTHTHTHTHSRAQDVHTVVSCTAACLSLRSLQAVRANQNGAHWEDVGAPDSDGVRSRRLRTVSITGTVSPAVSG